jgi:hydrogenase/urease accessory protein HupE
MRRTHKHLVRAATLCMSLLPAMVLAHPGHGSHGSFVEGAVHPASGIEHAAAFLFIGFLASCLSGSSVRPMIAALLGLLVAAWTADSDGWQYAAGFMFMGTILAAAGFAATRLITVSVTAAAPRSRI